MNTLKLNFSDFWPRFNKHENYFIDLLGKYYDIKIVEDPEVLIYSCYSFNFLKYNCHKIFFAPENVRPNYNECDFSFSFDYGEANGKNYRLPLFNLYGNVEKLIEEKNIDQIFSEKNKFCNMLVSNPRGKERNQFFHLLSEYKKVDSGGKFLNNIGSRVKDRFDFIKPYKFTLAFENSSYPGYTTEKIFEPMKVNSIPIYWGNPKVSTDFNPKSFVNVHDYENFNNAIDAIKKIDQNEDLYKSYLKEPYFKGNEIPKEFTNGIVLCKFIEVISSFKNTSPVLNRRKKLFLGYSNMYRKRFLNRFIFDKRIY